MGPFFHALEKVVDRYKLGVKIVRNLKKQLRGTNSGEVVILKDCINVAWLCLACSGLTGLLEL